MTRAESLMELQEHIQEIRDNLPDDFPVPNARYLLTAAMGALIDFSEQPENSPNFNNIPQAATGDEFQ